MLFPILGCVLFVYGASHWVRAGKQHAFWELLSELVPQPSREHLGPAFMSVGIHVFFAVLCQATGMALLVVS